MHKYREYYKVLRANGKLKKLRIFLLILSVGLIAGLSIGVNYKIRTTNIKESKVQQPDKQEKMFLKLDKESLTLDDNHRNVKIKVNTNYGNKMEVFDAEEDKLLTKANLKHGEATLTLYDEGKYKVIVSKDKKSKEKLFSILDKKSKENEENNEDDKKTDSTTSKEENEKSEPEPSTSQTTVPSEYSNALTKAQSYSRILHLSKKGIYKQLTSEYGGKFTPAAGQYAIDNLNVDYNFNALQKARSYERTLHLSTERLRQQLTSDYGAGFTAAEAEYAIQNLN